VIPNWKLLAKHVSWNIGSTRRVKAPALAIVSGLTLPSARYIEVAATELLTALNDPDNDLVRAAWQCWRNRSSCGPSAWRWTDGHRVGGILNALYHYGVHMDRTEVDALTGGFAHHAPLRHAPPNETCAVGGRMIPVRNCFWGVYDYGAAADSPAVDVWSDGSFHKDSGRAAASFVVGADPFIPQQFHHAASLQGMVATLRENRTGFGLALAQTKSSTEAELVAHCMVLTAFPLCVSLRCHIDAKSAISAISRFQECDQHRKRIRCRNRPLLKLIEHVTTLKRQAGATVTIDHVEAHTNRDDPLHCGNRAADALAKDLRISAVPKDPPWNEVDFPFVLRLGEAPVYGDPRVAMRTHMQNFQHQQWFDSPSQGKLYRAPGVAPLVALARTRSDLELGFRLRLFTETLPLGMTCLEHRDGMHESWGVCPVCNDANETLDHLLTCPAVTANPLSASEADIHAWQTSFSTSVADKLGALSADSKIRVAYTLGVIRKKDLDDFALRSLLFVQRCWDSRMALSSDHDRPPIG
jgi:hypothetical protein